MKKRNATPVLWGIGLRREDETSLAHLAGKDFRLHNHAAENFPEVKDLERAEPLLVWIPLRIWSNLNTARRQAFQNTDTVQRVLLLDEEHSLESLNQAMGAGFMDILKTPLEAQAVRNVLERALDVRNLYADIYRMTQEIYLERELLARKNEQLSFINRFLSRSAESMEPAEILVKAREDLDLLLPVSLLQAAMWQETPSGQVEAVLYLDMDLSGASRDQWTEFMTRSVTTLTEKPVAACQTVALPPSTLTKPDKDLRPQQGRVVVMPLRGGNKAFGCIVLLSQKPFNLGRDQVELLHSAVKHLSLALRNARLFDELRVKAQHDGLTGLHNRAHFETRLKEEHSRHQRYDHELSIMLMDLDHFKDINDTYGHAAGDMVLKEVGGLLDKSLRSTDYAARYGGEEFVVILPETDENHAWAIAERLRLQIARHRFRHDSQNLKLTASMGIASVKPGFFTSPDALLRNADEALYRAKANGRNIVMLHAANTLAMQA